MVVVVVLLLVIIVLVVIVVAANIVVMMVVQVIFDGWRRCRCPRQMIFYWIIIYCITTINISIPILGIPCFFFLR